MIKMLNVITGFFSGIISGMGIGGGAVLIPALIVTEGISQQLAQGINLTYFIPTALISLIVHIRNKNVLVRTALIIGVCGMAGSAAGSLIAVFADSGILRKMFGVFLLFVGFYEIFNGFRLKS